MLNETLPLGAITRISPLNPRRDMESDVAPLAAMIAACGLIDPLVVRARPDEPTQFEVLSGGRRWRALRLLEAQGNLDDEEKRIKVEVYSGADADALRIALAAAVAPRPQHPVDEFEAFAKLADLGFTTEAIAGDFGETERHVRQRLALGGLAPRLRDMWRRGEIDAEAAKAWASGPLEAQEALLDKMLAEGGHNISYVHGVRRELRGDVMPDWFPVSRFILSSDESVAAYVAAGGRVTDDLFQPAGLRDAAIAERVVNDFLRAHAERAAQAEGWAAGAIEADGYDAQEDEPETNEAEEITLHALEKEIAQCSPADAALAKAQRDEILRLATLRGYAPEDRARLAVVAALDNSGAVFFSRGHELAATPGESGEELEPGEDGEEQGEHDHDDNHDGEAAAKEPGKPVDLPPDPLARPKARPLADLIDETATKALRRIVRQRLDLALMLALAGNATAYAPGYRRSGAAILDDEEDCKLLVAMTHSADDFADAVLIASDASTNDLSVAFARRVAYAIDCAGVDYHAIDDLCCALARRGAPLKAAFAEALDARAFYEAMPKKDALRIVSTLIGDGEAKRVKKFDAMQLAAHIDILAREKAFLPVPFSNWARHEGETGNFDPRDAVDLDASAQPPALAQAMASAIDADEAKTSARNGEDMTDDEKARIRVETFLELDCLRGEAAGGQNLKSARAYEAFVAFCEAREMPPITHAAFGTAIEACGVAKKRLSGGVHYIGLALRDAKEEA